MKLSFLCDVAISPDGALTKVKVLVLTIHTEVHCDTTLLMYDYTLVTISYTVKPL